MRYIIIILSSIIFSINLFSYEKYVDFNLIKKAGEPRFVRNGVLFTLPLEKNNNAFLRTDLDGWRHDFHYRKSIYDILYVFVPYKPETKEIRYKININGYWVTDAKSKVSEDDVGNELSLIEINEANYCYEKNPVIEKNRGNIKKVLFRYYNPKASEVNLVLSVDNWNEYSHPMTKRDDGFWEITKNYTAGKYLYYFFVDGRKTGDMENGNAIYSPEKGQVAYFVIE
jgi:Carbohydrate-binding module 48 (Isoamylase N-terminal domain)